MLDARPPARVEGRRCSPAPASDTNTMASQAKLLRQSSVEVRAYIMEGLSCFAHVACRHLKQSAALSELDWQYGALHG